MSRPCVPIMLKSTNIYKLWCLMQISQTVLPDLTSECHSRNPSSSTHFSLIYSHKKIHLGLLSSSLFLSFFLSTNQCIYTFFFLTFSSAHILLAFLFHFFFNKFFLLRIFFFFFILLLITELCQSRGAWISKNLMKTDPATIIKVNRITMEDK